MGLDRRELFFLANPRAVELLRTEQSGNEQSAWDEFRKKDRIRRSHNIKADEMALLTAVSQMGEIRSAREFIYILHIVRFALGR